jgi:hypothetical protein
MACHYIKAKNETDFFTRLMKKREFDLVFKMAKCVISAYKRGKKEIEIFDITFDNSESMVFSIDKSNYKELLNNCLEDLISKEEYELCAEIKKILDQPKYKKKTKKTNIMEEK